MTKSTMDLWPLVRRFRILYRMIVVQLLLVLVVFSQEKFFLSAGLWGGQVDIWDIHHGVMVDSVLNLNGIHMVATSDGNKLYTNNENEYLYIADLTADTLLMNPNIYWDAYQLGEMKLAMNDSILLACDTEMGYLYLWDVKADTLLEAINLRLMSSPQTIAVSSDEKYIYLAGSVFIEKIDFDSLKEIDVNQLTGRLEQIVLSPDDSTIYGAGFYTTILNANTLDTIKTFDFLSDKILLDTLNNRLLCINSTKFSVIDLSSYAIDTLYDFTDTTYHFSFVRDMAFFSDMDSLLLVGQDGMLKLDRSTLQIGGRIDSVSYQSVYVWKAPGALNIKTPSVLSHGFDLYQNYPNPFNPSTHISFYLNKTGLIKLEVYDILGRKIRTLLNQKMSAGKHTLTWNGYNDNGKQVASGVYFYSLKVGSQVKVRKMIYIK